MPKSVVLVRVSQKKPSSRPKAFIAFSKQPVLGRHGKIVKCVDEEYAMACVKGILEKIRILKSHVKNMC
jgi:hypothetical protein